MRRLPLLLIPFLLAFGACAEEPEEKCEPTVSVEATPLTIASGETVRITVDVRGMELIDPDSDDEGPGGVNCAGHYNGYLDSTEGSALFKDTLEQIDVAIDGDPGEHELIVRLQDTGDVYLVPDVRDSVDITIQ
jgi:hypothetical protein